MEPQVIERQTYISTGLRGWNDYEQPLQNGEGMTLTLDEADEYFLPRVAPDQLGPPDPTQSASRRLDAQHDRPTA
jgi:hypothetical protein